MHDRQKGMGMMQEGRALTGDSSPEPRGFLASLRKEFKTGARQEAKVERQILINRGQAGKATP